MDRRTFLTAAGTAAAASLAGCGSASASPRPPRVPEELLAESGFERQDRTREQVLDRTVAGVDITATAITELYEDVELAAEIEEKTLGQITGPLAVFFASRITMSPNLADLPGGVGQQELVSEVAKQSRKTFEDQLASMGLGEITRESTGEMQVKTGETAETTAYSAVFPFEAFTFPVTEENVVKIEGGSIDVAGDLAVWVHDGGVNVAGGAYPAENFARSVEQDLSSAITVTVDIDLGLTPDAYAGEVESLIVEVE